MAISVGMTHERKHIVQQSDTASAAGSGTLPDVLSTPRVIGWMEGTAHTLIVPHLDDSQSTVGTLVNIRHLAATPVGMEVVTKAELLEIDGRRLRFHIEAWDAVEKIAEGDHERFIIDRERFIQRLQKKIAG